MRATIIIGCAITAAILTMTAAVIGGVVAANQISVDNGVVVRGFLVVVALAVTALIWWLRMRPTDRPEALLIGLMGGWFLNFSSWSGSAFVGQLFTSLTIGAFLIDLLLWGAVAFGLVLILSHTSAANQR